jgi:hypothetical protein
MEDVASCIYRIVRNTFLERLMRTVQKLKRPMDNQSAGASDRHQEERKKCTYGETLTGCFD